MRTMSGARAVGRGISEWHGRQRSTGVGGRTGAGFDDQCHMTHIDQRDCRRGINATSRGRTRL